MFWQTSSTRHRNMFRVIYICERRHVNSYNQTVPSKCHEQTVRCCKQRRTLKRSLADNFISLTDVDNVCDVKSGLRYVQVSASKSRCILT